jgi:hypothetical protein
MKKQSKAAKPKSLPAGITKAELDEVAAKYGAGNAVAIGDAAANTVSLLTFAGTWCKTSKRFIGAYVLGPESAINPDIPPADFLKLPGQVQAQGKAKK